MGVKRRVGDGAWSGVHAARASSSWQYFASSTSREFWNLAAISITCSGISPSCAPILHMAESTQQRVEAWVNCRSTASHNRSSTWRTAEQKRMSGRIAVD